MSNLEIAALAVALAIDAFSVAASAGPKAPPKWGPLRMAGSFGIFQAGMPLLGALAGAYLLVYVRAYDHWVAFGVLELVGAKMIIEAFRGGEGQDAAGGSADPSRGLALLSLSIATSIDAFGAGVGMRMVGANFWVASPVIGIVCAVLTYVGAGLGTAARKHLGRKAEVLGGAVLIGLGIKMLRI